MVEPRIDAEQRNRSALVLKLLFTLTVGVSGGLVSIQAGGDTQFALTAAAIGLVVGAVMTWFVSRNIRRVQPEGIQKRREMERRRQRDREE
jgi:membrane associated rhomboid family serine protease